MPIQLRPGDDDHFYAIIVHHSTEGSTFKMLDGEPDAWLSHDDLLTYTRLGFLPDKEVPAVVHQIGPFDDATMALFWEKVPKYASARFVTAYDFYLKLNAIMMYYTMETENPDVAIISGDMMDEMAVAAHRASQSDAA